ncbi:MAG: hypothetical protein ACYCYP_06470 [Leptospirales bacterium]
MIATALHPFLVHFLIAGGGIFLLSRIPGRLSSTLSPMIRSLSIGLILLFPVVLMAGVLARKVLIAHHVSGNGHGLVIHLWMGVLTAGVWVPMLAGHLFQDAKDRVHGRWGWFQGPGWLIFAALMMVVTAALGGELVYGSHGFSFPVR